MWTWKTKKQISCAVTAQLISNCTADQCLCFRNMDSTIHLVLKHKVSSFLGSSVTLQAVLCLTWSEDQFSHDVAHFCFTIGVLYL